MGGTVAVTISRHVYVGLQAPFRRVKVQQSAEVTSINKMEHYLFHATIPYTYMFIMVEAVNM